MNLKRVLQGDITAEELEKIADASPEKERAGSRCEAYFYTGRIAWIRGDRAAAVARLDRCLATRQTDCMEFTAARTVLRWPR